MEYSLFVVEKVVGSFFFVPYLDELLNGPLPENKIRKLLDYLSFPRFFPLTVQYIFHKVDDDSIKSLPEEAEICGVRDDFVKNMGNNFFMDHTFFRKLSQNNIIIPLGSMEELRGE